MNEQNRSYSIAHRFDAGRVLELLSSALDSAAFAYWIDRASFSAHFPEGWSIDDVAWLDGEDREVWRACSKSAFAPLVGGAWTFRDIEGKERRIGDRDIANGLAIMAASCPRLFFEIVAGEDDARTVDVLVQCCALGGLVYG